jgi:hypothetical protein
MAVRTGRPTTHAPTSVYRCDVRRVHGIQPLRATCPGVAARGRGKKAVLQSALLAVPQAAASGATDDSAPAASSSMSGSAVALGSEEERRNVKESWERILRWARLAKECAPCCAWRDVAQH